MSTTTGRLVAAPRRHASRDRRQEHPARHLQSFTGTLQADAYSGYNELYDASRAPGPVTPALCWAHARRQFFELADIARHERGGDPPIALQAVKRSMFCSISSAVSTGKMRRNGCGCAKSKASRLSDVRGRYVENI